MSEQYVPNWEKAADHGRANEVGRAKEGSPECACCNNPIEKEQIALCENTKELSFLGFGFPLYYMFLRNCILLLVVITLSYNVMSLFTSMEKAAQLCKSPSSTPAHHELSFGRFHQDEGNSSESTGLGTKCTSFMVYWANTDKTVNNYYNLLRVSSFIIHMAALLYIKDKILKAFDYYDERENDLSDYSVLFNEIPESIDIKKKLYAFVKDVDPKFIIEEIVLVPGSDDLHQLEEEKEEVLEKYFEAKTQNKHHQSEHFLKEVQEIDHKIFETAEKSIKKIDKDEIWCENAIIIFNLETMKDQFLERFQQPGVKEQLTKYFGPEGPSIEVDEAPQPREIIWKNLKFRNQKKKNILKGWCLSILFLASITVVFFFLNNFKTELLDQAIENAESNPSGSSTQKTLAFIIAYVILLGIVFFNKFVMGFILHIFTHMELHENKADEDFSFAAKYALGMFFTTAMMTIAVEALKYKNYYTHEFGVIESETLMFFFCSFLIPTIWLIHPWQVCHEIQRHHHHGKDNVSQKEANHLMADYHYDMGKRYAEILEMMWFTFLYLDIIPIGSFLIAIGFGIYYWVDKYNLLRRSSLEGNVSGDLTINALRLLDLTVFFRFLGELIFDNQIRDGIRFSTVIYLVLSIVFLFIPWEDILNSVNFQYFFPNKIPYPEEKKNFINQNYYNMHPIYHVIMSTSEGKDVGEAKLLANEILLLITDKPSNLRKKASFEEDLTFLEAVTLVSKQKKMAKSKLQPNSPISFLDAIMTLSRQKKEQTIAKRKSLTKIQKQQSSSSNQKNKEIEAKQVSNVPQIEKNEKKLMEKRQKRNVCC